MISSNSSHDDAGDDGDDDDNAGDDGEGGDVCGCVRLEPTKDAVARQRQIE